MHAERPGDGRQEDAINERERQVLQALVDAHIQTAEPVGSKAIAKITEMGLSPATIRNVLAALHDKGFIEQPHTSAGRVPTDRGLRYYVDSLLHLQKPTEEEASEIASRIGEAGSLDTALREATKVLVRMSRHTTLVVAPRPEAGRLRHLELVRLRDDAVLLIVVGAEGKVQNRLLEWRGSVAERAPDDATLERLGRRMTEIVQGRTFDEGRGLLHKELAIADAELKDLEKRLVAISADGLRTKLEAPEVHVEGAAHLLESAQSLERTRELLALLEEGNQVKAILEHAARAPGIRIFIGEENPSSALYERGVVSAPIGVGGALGVLGVIGPRHLDYARVVPLVDLTVQVVAKVLQG